MSTIIVDAIQNGSFPDSEEILTSDLKHDDMSSLLDELQITKRELNDSVCNISKEQAGDVDGWISQARKAQQDIARCKEDYKYILEEHTRIERLRDARLDARSKVALLEDEISFNSALQDQIRLIAQAATVLNQIDSDINNTELLRAAETFSPLTSTIARITSKQSQSLLLQSKDDLQRRLVAQLNTSIDHHISLERDGHQITFQTVQDVDKSSSIRTPLEEVIDALEAVDGLQDTVKSMVQRLETKVMPHLHQRSRLHISDANRSGTTLILNLTEVCPDAASTIEAVKSLLEYVSDSLPAKISSSLVQGLCDKMVPLLIVNWLDPAIPPGLEQLAQSNGIQEEAEDLAKWLNQPEIDRGGDLTAWVNQIPRTWLSRRKANSLDVVRNALKTAKGTTKQVERVERQVVTLEEQQIKVGTNADDWSDNWDDEEDTNETKQSENTEDDGSDAWGFDNDEQEVKTTPTTTNQAEEDEGDAWGWGDDDEAAEQPKTPAPKTTTKANGIPGSAPKETEMTLSEKYTVTDIPDLILDSIARDITDHQTLQTTPQKFFPNRSTTTTATTPPSSGMQTLPTLTLAMFRASAPDHYSTTPTLSRMNLYNDTLYLMQQLDSSAKNPSPSLSADLHALSKFARQTYTSELAQQRTILHDLLDNAQGFVSCTIEPYLSQCESAIASTTDYIRALHAQWAPILSVSHLAQSIGSLLNSVMGKMIKDIEDMEDISEAQSQKLIQFMDGVGKLDDLFRSPQQQAGGPSMVEEGESGLPATTIALHVSSYLRFQYLQQILEGSLADIKYLWTDAGLGLEFSAEEVVDLIKALFAESSHRRSAIQVIRSNG